MKLSTSARLLNTIHKNATAIASIDLPQDGNYVGLLKATFVKSLEFARYSNRITIEKAGETAFFMAPALRGICEDLIVLSFLRPLPPEDRDEVILIEFVRSTRKSTREQVKFFQEIRPFQPVVTGVQFTSQPRTAFGADVPKKIHDEATEDQEALEHAARLTAIGIKSNLWRTEGKLPPVDQMATTVNLRSVYDYFYRTASDVVHFNPRMSLRMGWGDTPQEIVFSTKHFAQYFLEFNQVYSIFLFDLICAQFAQELLLTPKLIKLVSALRADLDEMVRWPEAVTFEEMNDRGPGTLQRMLLKIAHENKINASRRAD